MKIYLHDNRIWLIFLLLSFFFQSSFAQFGTPLVIDSSNNALINNIHVIDLDNDNQNDIVVSNLYDSVYWYKNNSLSFARMPAVSNTMQRPVFIDHADVDGNGFEDLLVSYDEVYAGIRLFKNFNGGTSWQEVVINDSIDVAVVRSYLVDMDNDSDLDVISCQDLEIAVYLQTAGAFSGMIKVADSSEFYNLAVHDFNGDGFVDFAAHSAAGVRLYINNQNLTFSHQTFTTQLFVTLESCDIDKDGNFDIFYPDINLSANMIIWKNDGAGSFSNFQSVPFNAGNISNPPLKFHNIDTDTFPDALYIPLVNRGLYYKSNDGTGGLNTTHFIDSVYRYTYVNAGDLDGDNDNDLVWFANEPFGIKRLGITINLAATTGLDVHSKILFEVYPNPVNDFLLINNPQNCLGSVSISDVTGRLLYSSETLSQKINTHSWLPGVYIIEISSTNNLFVYKVMKQ